MSMAEPLTVLKMELLQNVVPQIIDLLSKSMADAVPVHDVERGLWGLLLQMGQEALQAFFDSHGSGDIGEILVLAEGQQVHRLPELHSRR